MSEDALAWVRTGVPGRLAFATVDPTGPMAAAADGDATGDDPREEHADDEWSPKLREGSSAESRWNDVSELLLPFCRLVRVDGESLERAGRGIGEWFGGVRRVSTRSPSSLQRSRALKLRRCRVEADLGGTGEPFSSVPRASSPCASPLRAIWSTLCELELLRKTEKRGCADRTDAMV